MSTLTHKPKTQAQTSETSVVGPETSEQLGGNQAVLGQMSTAASADFGYLDGFMEDFEAPSLTDWAAPLTEVDDNDQTLSDSTRTDLPTIGTDLGAVAVDSKKLEAQQTVTHSQDSNELLGDSSTKVQTRGSVDRTGTVKGGLGGAHESFDGDIAAKGGVMVGSDGTFAADTQVKLGNVEGGVAATVDLAEDGRLESVAAQGTLAVGDNAISAGFHIEPLSVSVEGNTVVWRSSYGVSSEGKIVGAGLGVAHDRVQQESRSFEDPRTAVAFAEGLRNGDVTIASNRDFTAEQVARLNEGEALSYASQVDTKGTFLVVDGQDTAIEGVQIRKGKGETITIDFMTRDSQDASYGPNNGILGAEFVFGGTHASTQMRAELDLSDPEQAALFDTFQQTGELPEHLVTDAEVLEGEHAARAATLPGASIRQTNSQEEGTKTVNGEKEQVVRSSEVTGITDLGWSVLPYGAEQLMRGMDTLSNIVPHGKDTRWGTIADTYERIGDRWYDQGLQNGSQAGEERHTVDVLFAMDGTEQEKLDSMHIHQVQQMDFDDQQQSARALEDAVTPDFDAEGIDPAKLPEAGKSDRTWTMESLIDEEGTRRIREELASEKGVGYEWQAGKTIEWLRATYYRGNEDMTALEHARAMAALGRYGGEDAAEGMRKAAGEDHVERFLQLEGDNTWIGRESSQRLDAQLDVALSGRNPIAIQELLTFETARLDRILDDEAYAEVPDALRDEEAARIQHRVHRLQEAL